MLFQLLNNVKRKVTLFLCLVTPLSSLAVEEDPTVIALFGDSITVGYNLAYSHVIVANGTTTNGKPTIYLNELLNEGSQKRTSVVSNWGYGGSSSTSGVNRITSNLNSLTSSYVGKDYYVLILYGTNDPGYGISNSTTKFNIQTMIDRARSAGYEPIIGTLTPVSNRDVQPLNAQIVAAANSRNAFVVDHYSRFISEPGGWTSLIELDGGIRLHPNNDGYLVIAENWFNSRLKDIIEPDSNGSVVGAILLLLLD